MRQTVFRSARKEFGGLRHTIFCVGDDRARGREFLQTSIAAHQSPDFPLWSAANARRENIAITAFEPTNFEQRIGPASTRSTAGTRRVSEATSSR